MLSYIPYMFACIFIFVFGTFFSISSELWFGIWVGLEINLIGFLPVMMYNANSIESEAGIKYFVMQALGSSLLMFASLFKYSVSFTWDNLSSDLPSSYWWLFLIIISLMIKMGSFPFHFWLPGVMGPLGWVPCMFLATWQKVAPCYLISSLFFLDISDIYFWVFIIFLSGGALLGGLGGLNQSQIRIMLAYSSINHMSWLLLAAWCSMSLMLFYLMVYMILTISLFMTLWYLNLNSYNQLNFFSENLAMLLMISGMLVSLAGVPPLMGFIPKLYLIEVMAELNMFVLALFLFLGSLFSLFYYLILFCSVTMASFQKHLYFPHSSISYTILFTAIFSLNSLGFLLIFFPYYY